MAEEAFYTRVRGKISGPFDLPALQKLVKRGDLYKIHEISSDRIAWSTAGDFEDLFPAPPPPSVRRPGARQETEPPIAGAQAAAEISAVEATAPANAASLPHGLYYYTQRGSTVGPVPLPVLKTLVENGTLQSTDLVWRENAETGVPAALMPALAPSFGGLQTSGIPRNLSGRHRPIDPTGRLQAAMTSAASMARTTGILAGATLLVLINLPWLVVDKHLIWWWYLYRAPDGASMAAFVTFMVVAAIAVCITAPLTAGFARAVVYISLMFSISIACSITLLTNGAPSSVQVALLVVLSMAILLGVCLFRHVLPESTGGRILLGICSGTVTVGMLAGVIDSLSNSRGLGQVPGGIIFGTILVFVGMIAGVATGVLGFVGLKPTFTAALNYATIIAGAASLVLPAIGIIIAIVSLAEAGFGPRGEVFPLFTESIIVIAEVAARSIMIVSGCVAVVIVGAHELLLCSHVGAEHR